jgi:hypothetical protein
MSADDRLTWGAAPSQGFAETRLRGFVYGRALWVTARLPPTLTKVRGWSVWLASGIGVPLHQGRTPLRRLRSPAPHRGAWGIDARRLSRRHGVGMRLAANAGVRPRGGPGLLPRARKT